MLHELVFYYITDPLRTLACLWELYKKDNHEKMWCQHNYRCLASRHTVELCFTVTLVTHPHHLTIVPAFCLHPHKNSQDTTNLDRPERRFGLKMNQKTNDDPEY